MDRKFGIYISLLPCFGLAFVIHTGFNLMFLIGPVQIQIGKWY